MERDGIQVWGWIGVLLGFVTGLITFVSFSIMIGLSTYRALALKRSVWSLPVTVKGAESGRVEQLTFPIKERIQLGVPEEELVDVIATLAKFFANKNYVTAAHLGSLQILHPEKESRLCYTLGIQCSSDEVGINRHAFEILETMRDAKWPISVLPFTNQYFTKDAITIFRRDPKLQMVVPDEKS